MCLRDAKCVQFTPIFTDGLTEKLRHCVLCKEGRLVVVELKDTVQLLAFDHLKNTGSFIDITKVTLDLVKTFLILSYKNHVIPYSFFSILNMITSTVS